MTLKKYIEKRKLEMVKANQELATNKQLLQANLNATNQKLFELEVELKVLDRLEAALLKPAKDEPKPEEGK
tara:strand:- start:110 stop:322 length:213 start_codon:yes stop_codon:yes gene_type:complete